MRVIVAGALANKPGYGGEAWVRLAWVLGLEALDAEVLFVEEIDPPVRDPDGKPDSRAVRFFEDVCRRFGFADRAALLGTDGSGVAGPSPAEVLDFAAGADLLVNISGHLRHERVCSAVRRRAYVDLDPGYTQFWHDAGVGDLRLADHDVHFTVGAKVGTAECPIPTCGIGWIPMRQPVLLDAWAPAAPIGSTRFTTVASWRGSYGPVNHAGRSYGLKAHEFRKLAALPRRVPVEFEIALDIHPADAPDAQLMREHGWRIADPDGAAGTPESFRAYVRGSSAEFSVAQGVYVETGSGWFSDRSARYLAAGRPVVVQDTGLDGSLPTGEGILAFTGAAEAEAAVRSVTTEWTRHARAARQIAEEHFDAARVIPAFLDRALAARRTHPVGTGIPAPSANGRAHSSVDSAIVVSGMVARVPRQGGATWAALQYVLGLSRLGHRVLFVEELGRDDLLPEGVTLAGSRNAAYFRRVVQRFGLGGMASLLIGGSRETVGLPRAELERRIGPGSTLLNLSGSLRDPDLAARFERRVYVDLDPAFTQLWHDVEGIDVGMGGHTHYATVGLELGKDGCDIPSCSVPWIRFLPPVVLDLWEPGARLQRDALTTVANWRGYGSVTWNGTHFGQKAHAFRELFELPTRVRDERFEVALAIHEDEEADLAALASNRWQVLDPEQVAGSPDRYRRFVRGSAMELGVAKAGYVRSRCGWFSDRSACYLAAGRPVLAQDTGFRRHLPTDAGLLGFSSLDEAVEGVREIRSDYARHAHAARRIAEEHLDARKVLAKLLEDVA